MPKWLDGRPSLDRGRMKGALTHKYGVDYSHRYGARCPDCGSARTPSYKTLGWNGRTRTRYHKCPVCSANFKSIERDS